MTPANIAAQIAADHLPEKLDLVYVHYDNQLSDEQIGYLLADDWESLYSDLAEWESDSRWEGVKYYLDDLSDIIQDAADKSDVYYSDEIEDELRYIIEDRDESDPIRDLISNTPDVFVRYDLGELDTDNNIRNILFSHSIDLSDKSNSEAIQDIEDNAYEVYNGLHHLYILASVPLSDVLPGAKVTLTNFNIVALDTWSGQGFDGAITGTITVDATTDYGFFLDTSDSYGWAATAGPVESAYRPDHITREPLTTTNN